MSTTASGRTKKEKAAKLLPWQIEAQERQREINDYVAMLRDGSDDYLVSIAREALRHYHEGMMRGDKEGRRPYELLIEACVDTLYRVVEYGGHEDRPDGSGRAWPPRSRSRFDCWNSASRWLGEQLAAAPGDLPMHGQPGRFVLEIHGCRTDVQYPGLFGGPGLDGRVIDLDRPFFSETGYRSFTAGGLSRERWFSEDGAMEVAELLTIVMEETLLTDMNGKRMNEPILHKPPFGLSYYQHGKHHRPSPQYMLDQRKKDPAWQRGGFLYNLPGQRIAIREERSGQLALAF